MGHKNELAKRQRGIWTDSNWIQLSDKTWPVSSVGKTWTECPRTMRLDSLEEHWAKDSGK